MGMSFSFAGFGLLIGNPVGGAILKSSGWTGVQAFCGATVIAAAFCCIIARVSKVGTKILAKG